ncbi:redoxin family protein [Methanolobus sp. ZRKC5]|uniref:TlpA family protein disulfide reductase n=1 Tax=Methanolobus sp. ZRKC5 TaxID=3136295 RepID=UPI00313E2027
MHILKNIFVFSFIISVILVVGCVEQTTEDTLVDWRDTELTDIATGETFRISDFKGSPVMLESFAVWCPTCLKQQKEVQTFRLTEGNTSNNVVHISLDTDPNEDEEQVREYFENNGFDWYFAIAPPEMTRSMIDELGPQVVVAPSAPVVLICEDQSARLMARGVKSPEDLQEELDQGC